MRNIIKTIIFAMVIIGFLLLGNTAEAAAVNPTVRGDISIFYTKDGEGFENLPINAYRVAKINSDGSYELLDPFTNYPVTINEMLSNTEWQTAAATLASYVEADQLESYCMIDTDHTGTVMMENMHTGLYLITGVFANKGEEIYEFTDFFVSLPAKGSNGGYSYVVNVRPKCSLYIPPTDYKVVKLWKDSENPAARPTSVKVEIMKDGTVNETIVLNADNNWSYEWQAEQGLGDWSVVERKVAANYQVEIVRQGDTFQIINTYVKKEENKESSTNSADEKNETSKNEKDYDAFSEEKIASKGTSTGDQAPTMLYVFILFISGALLFVLGTYRSRRK